MNKILMTMGDPAGIGPEVVVKCLAKIISQDGLEPVVVGEREILEETCKGLGLKIQFCPDDSPRHGRVKVRSMDLVRPGDFELGKVSAMCGNAAYHYFAHAVESCLAGEAQAI